MTDEERDAIVKRFGEAVNMDVPNLSSWLKTKESHSVGWPKDRPPGVESVGHASGRYIVRLLDKPVDKLTEDDLKHMRKVVGYVSRHLKQRPAGDVTHTRWRYSLMNWGHDPLN